jgi:hypothetical protein
VVGMTLVDLWKSNPEYFRGKTIQQLLGIAGDGKLRDGNETSTEFREFLGHVPSDSLAIFANYCLETSFLDSGLVLQEVINQIGRRLSFKVEHGRYRGTSGRVGFDGVWRTEDNTAILIEVKTTDAYRLSLDVTAKYRKTLIDEKIISELSSSILYIVGRFDTGDLEAQVRGSRHAWDVRLISTQALIHLLKIKEELQDQTTINRIRNILAPQEFTKVDSIIDLVFTTANEIKQDDLEKEPEEPEENKKSKRAGFIPVNFRDECVAKLQVRFKESLIKQTAVIYSTPDEKISVYCAISREYGKGDRKDYWFGFLPAQKTALEGYPEGFVAFGCGSPRQLVVIPLKLFIGWLPLFNRTETETRSYWHISISKIKNKFFVVPKKQHDDIDVTKYAIVGS